MPRPLHEIAAEIYNDWERPSPYAMPYMSALRILDSVNDMYYNDSAFEIVARFLANASSWRGPVAKRIKIELRQLIGLK